MGTTARKGSATPKRTRRSLRTARRISIGGLVLLLAAGIGYLASTYGPGGTVGAGDPAPTFALTDSDGVQVNLADSLGRKPILLVFYMTFG